MSSQPLLPPKDQAPLIRRRRIWRPFVPLLAIILALLSFQPSFSPSLSNLIPPDVPRTAMLLTAHPDDEVMFFSPSIMSFIHGGWNLHGLCLSVGNGSGLGDMRREELYRSYEVLGVERSHVEVLDHPKLQDGMDQHWDPRVVAPIIEGYLDTHPVSLIITFDSGGITNHPNHTPLPAALSLLHLQSEVTTLHLHSPSLIGKFTGPLYAIYYILASHISRFIPYFRMSKGEGGGLTKIVVVSTPRQWFKGFSAMLHHRSQLVWFRWLYLAFSRLMWVNEILLEAP